MAKITYTCNNPEMFALKEEDLTRSDGRWLFYTEDGEDKEFCRAIYKLILDGDSEDAIRGIDNNYEFSAVRFSKNKFVFTLFHREHYRCGYCVETGSKHWDSEMKPLFSITTPTPNVKAIEWAASVIKPALPFDAPF